MSTTPLQALESHLGRIIEPVCQNFYVTQLDGQVCIAFEPDGFQKDLLVSSLPEMIGKLEKVVSVRLIMIGQESVDPRAVRKLFPTSSRVAGIEEEERAQNQLRLLDYLLREFTRESSLFLISPSGVYLNAYLKDGSDPPCSAGRMEGKTLADVVGHSAAAEILTAAKRACQTGSETSALYSTRFANGEVRHYAAKLTPFNGDGQFLASVVRL